MEGHDCLRLVAGKGVKRVLGAVMGTIGLLVIAATRLSIAGTAREVLANHWLAFGMHNLILMSWRQR